MRREYQVSIEIDGVQVPAGIISGSGSEDARFRYLPMYINSGNRPLSISLPFQKETFSAMQTRKYFEGLLPEGFARKSVSEWIHVTEDDYLTILGALGRECLGAIMISDGEPVQDSYEELEIEQVRALAREGIRKTMEMITAAHLSLTGASGKVGLYYDENRRKWYLPKGSAPSTHIVKQSHVRLGGIIANEQLSLMTARFCGIEVPESFVINTGEYEDGDILLATKRYDRLLAETESGTEELVRPRRIHQEDFAQAMGIESSEKYERSGDGYMAKAFNLLRSVSADPIADQLKLWDILVFDYLIGNTDNHIKNLSLLYRSDMKAVRLAPAYDILSTCVYEGSSRDMAIGIGGEFSIDKITREHFDQAAESVGIGVNLARKRFEALATRFEPALQDASKRLETEGFTDVWKIADSILRNGGYYMLG